VAALTTVLAMGLGFAVAPEDSWVYFTQRMLGAEGVGQLAYTFNQSLTGMLSRLAQPGEPNRIVWLLFIGPVLVYGLWRAARAARHGDELTGMTLTGFVGSLVSPLTWSHHIFYYVPALIVLVDSAMPPHGASGPVLDGLRSRRALWITAVAVYLTVTFSVISLWTFNLHQVGGVLGFILSNWFLWIMLALVPLLPIRRVPRASPRPAGERVIRTTISWGAILRARRESAQPSAAPEATAP
jgi:alpha-1,2-mannosyltransferase